MKKLWNILQKIILQAVDLLEHFLGGFDSLLYALAVFVVISFITSVMCYIVDKKSISKKDFSCVARKILIFLLVGVANVLEVNVIATESVLRKAVIFFYISNEGICIMENAVRMGLPVPEIIKRILEQLHNKLGF